MLPGQALYDGWGRELLVSASEIGGRPRIVSAGRDGVFAWNPGKDGVLAANLAAVAAAVHGTAWGAPGAVGDDRRGDLDNLGTGVEAR